MRRGDVELGRTGAEAKQLKNAVTGARSRDLQLRFRAFLALFDDTGGSGEEAGGRSYVRVPSPVGEVDGKAWFSGEQCQARVYRFVERESQFLKREKVSENYKKNYFFLLFSFIKII